MSWMLFQSRPCQHRATQRQRLVDPPDCPDSIVSPVAGRIGGRRGNVHALGTARDPPALLHALKLSPAGLLRLALHVVVVVIAASRPDEEGSRQQRRRAGANLLDGGNMVGERRRVDENLLVEPALPSACARIRSSRCNVEPRRPARPTEHVGLP